MFNFLKKSKELPKNNNEIKTVFSIRLATEVISLPDIQDKTQLDVKYALIEPYAYAHIFWDKENHELVYYLEEPKLDEQEKSILTLIEDGLRELINISFINIKDQQIVIEYLEKNVRILLNELHITVNEDTFLKFMYYIYRDFIGLNEIEPLMQDYFIEDIECNGSKTPIFIVHRKYRNLRTNIIYPDNKVLASFVEKLAQKAGKYVSYSNPLLDGSLPGGSRVNATYTTDVSSRGPTFTLRKFTKEPWTPVKLIDFRTVSPEIMAYLWLAIEYESNIMVIGGTGTGKCVTGDTLVYLADGGIKKIKDLVEEKFNTSDEINENFGWEYVQCDDIRVLSMHKDELKIIENRVDKLWRHKAPKVLFRIRTRSGRNVTTTAEHPFFTLNNGEVIKVRADKITKEDKIAVPRNINLETKFKDFNLNESLKHRKDVYVVDAFKEVESAINIIKEKTKKTEIQIAKDKGIKLRTFGCWKNKNAIPVKYYYELLRESGLNLKEDLVIKGKTSSLSILVPKASSEIYKFVAYLIADGHLNKTNIKFFNMSKELRDEFKYLGEKVFGIKAKEEFPKDRTPNITFFSQPIAAILNEAFEVPYGNKAHIVKVPETLYLQDNATIARFIQAIADCESHIGRTEIEFSTTSKQLVEGLSRLLLRVGVISYVATRENHYRLYISGTENLRTYYNKVSYTHPKKRNALYKIVNRKISRIISNVDLVPNVSNLFRTARLPLDIGQSELATNIGISRRMVGMIEDCYRNPSIHAFRAFNNYICEADVDYELKNKINQFAESNIFWDEVIEIEKLINHNEDYVYDLTINEHHNFLAGNIPIVVHNTSFLNAISFFIPPAARVVSIEDTKELSLMQENWLPTVAREGTGLANLIGQKHGEVSLFDLLKESFRQRPDYVIVGEIRGKEAYVLFQGMSSGHPSFGTMHAEDVNTMVRRLETEPINLSPSLVESLDIVCVMTQTKVGGVDVRRIREIVEIISVKEQLGKIETNIPFVRDPATDKFFFRTNSYVFDKISKRHGVNKNILLREFQLRSKLLFQLYKNKIFSFKEVQNMVNDYYKTPEIVLKKFNII